MKPAEQTDWKAEALPAKRITIRLDRTFRPVEMMLIMRGLVPKQMEDKWFIYGKDDALYFHRSWTGVCVYVVRFVAEGDHYRMIEAGVNRDPGQYGGNDDEEDARRISRLIDILLLRRSPGPSGNEPPSGQQALREWSLLGRALFGEHPGSE